MKTYCNDDLGFEMEVPDKWSLPAFGASKSFFGKSIAFGCEYFESFNLQIRPLNPQPLPEQTENEFRRFIQDNNYTSLDFGRIIVEGKEHIWARYYLGSGKSTKKYMVIISGIEYAFRATCFYQQMLLEREKVWDSVVASFRIKPPSFVANWKSDKQNKDKSNFLERKIVGSQTAGRGILGFHSEAKRSLEGMKTYRSEQHGFEIELPENWQPAPIPAQGGKDLFQYGCSDEAINFEVSPLYPEPSLDDTEIEFALFARNRGFMDLKISRIMVAGKEHVCASYFVNDWMGRRWNKKYALVLGRTEYAITATCNDPGWFAKKEQDWDAIIQSFRLLAPVGAAVPLSEKENRELEQRREIVQERIEMRDALGDDYARAYEAVTLGQYDQARTFLEACLRDDPEHILAHKELAVVLEKLGDRNGALRHRREVKRLAPNDLINRANLVKLLTAKWKKAEALRETREALTISPNDPIFLDIEKKLTASPATNIFRKLENKLAAPPAPNYRVTFYSSLICLLLADISLFFPGYLLVNWPCMRVLMLMPVFGLYISGPSVRIPKNLAALLGILLYLFLWWKTA